MNKVINPVLCTVRTVRGNQQKARGYCDINYDDGKLSITGVVGPMSNGDCKGSAGQCVGSIRDGEPNTKEGWTREMVDKFCDIWGRWHLNDLNPCCKHQRELGWIDQAREPMYKYHYKLRREAADKKRMVEKSAMSHLRDGISFAPTAEQSFYARLDNFIDGYKPVEEDLADYYEPFWSISRGAIERTERGFVRFDEDDQGILLKPCPVCGYKYGTAWQTEEIPQDVIDWLFALPNTKIQPAWI